jgi:hypothetical protein
MAMTAYIPFLDRGAASLAAPGIFTDVNAFAFGFDADRAALQRTTDAILNAAAAPPLRYEAFTARALATFITAARCTSGPDVVGWCPGRECALWIPLFEWKGGLLPRLVLWSPYIFIDYTIGMLTGRDIWGWPKTLAQIGVAADRPDQPARFTCDTMTFHPMRRDTQGQVRTLFAVASAAPLGAPRGAWGSGLEAISGFVGALGSPAAELFARIGLAPRVTAVALKQLRDAADMDAAVYRAIIESPVRVTAFQGGGLLGGDFRLVLAQCESHQVVRDFLGTTPTTPTVEVPVTWAAHARIDFEALPGRVIQAA